MVIKDGRFSNYSHNMAEFIGKDNALIILTMIQKGHKPDQAFTQV
jgi:hypothetical protein